MTQDIDVGKLAEQINDKADRDLWNTVPNVWNNTLNTSQITNCITEIPQDIKLELKDGTLTLKAGSKVYVPNGVGTFTNVVTPADKSWGHTTYASGKLMLFYRSKYNDLFALNDYDCYSGSSSPTAIDNMVWYDTTNGKIKWTNNGGSTWNDEGLSLPLTNSSYTNGTGFTSIDQVFNGFGYIGSTAFALPGVKGLIPNGRNEDGSLKNIEFITTSVLTFTPSFNGSSILLLNSNNFTSWGKSDYSYGNDDNYNYFKDGKHYALCKIGEYYKDSSGVITSFTPKTAFHAVDRNDSSWLSGLAMPSNKYIDLTLGATGTVYTAPANGYFAILKSATATKQYMQCRNKTTGLGIETHATSDNTALRQFIPAAKGQQVAFSYTAAGTLTFFRFVYAEGEN